MFTMFWTFEQKADSLSYGIPKSPSYTGSCFHFRCILSQSVAITAIKQETCLKKTYSIYFLSLPSKPKPHFMCFHKPLDESSSMGCLNAVMSLNVHRKSTTLSCSLRMGAIFTKNHTGIPVQGQDGEIWLVPSHCLNRYVIQLSTYGSSCTWEFQRSSFHNSQRSGVLSHTSPCQWVPHTWSWEKKMGINCTLMSAEA